MQYQDYLRTLRRGWRLIVASVVVCLLIGGLMIARAQPTYSATAELFVAPGSGPSTTQLVQGSAFFADRVKTYAQIVDSTVVLEPVVKELGLHMSSRALAAHVSATAPIDTVLLRIHVTDTDPEQAAAVANAVAKRFQTVATDLETVKGSKDDPVVRVTIVQPATVPSVPISPNRKLILLLAGMIGLAIGFAIAVFREALNNRVRSEANLRAITDMPVVGKIPQKARDDSILLAGEASHGFRAEAFRQLRTNLQYLDVSDEHHTFVITSALPSEGKTVTAANLALTIADAGMSVCLVEADLRRPRLSRLLDLEPEIGLTSIIIGTITAEAAAQRWGGTGVDVIAAGYLPPNPSELLSSQRMTELLDELKRKYDFVILDTPPLLAVTDAAILARSCGGAIMVVSTKGRHTVTREQLLESFENLETAGTKVLGVVLNRLPTKGPDAIALSEYGYAAGQSPVPVLAADSPLLSSAADNPLASTTAANLPSTSAADKPLASAAAANPRRSSSATGKPRSSSATGKPRSSSATGKPRSSSAAGKPRASSADDNPPASSATGNSQRSTPADDNPPASSATGNSQRSTSSRRQPARHRQHTDDTQPTSSADDNPPSSSAADNPPPSSADPNPPSPAAADDTRPSRRQRAPTRSTRPRRTPRTPAPRR